METPTPPEEKVHILAPENLPPPETNSSVPRIFDEKQRLAIVIELIKTGAPTSVIAARHSIAPRLLRNWSNTYNVRASQILSEQRTPQKEASHMESKDTPPRNKHRPVSTEIKDKALKRLLSGNEGLKQIASDLGLSPHTVRNYYQLKTGKLLRTRELGKAKALERAEEAGKAPIGGGRVIKTKTGERKLYSHKEQILYAVRYRKLKINNFAEGARLLGVGAGPLRDWVMKFDSMKPQERGATARYAADPKAPSPQDETKQQALDRVAAGERAIDVAAEVGAHVSSLRNWWEKYRKGKKWPSQMKFSGQHIEPQKKLRGPQKKTLQRMQIRDALVNNGELISAQQLAAETVTHVNGAPVPLSTGKAMRDVIIFLQLARDEFDREIKLGHMRCDNPAMLHAMLALHSATK